MSRFPHLLLWFAQSNVFAEARAVAVPPEALAAHQLDARGAGDATRSARGALRPGAPELLCGGVVGVLVLTLRGQAVGPPSHVLRVLVAAELHAHARHAVRGCPRAKYAGGPVGIPFGGEGGDPGQHLLAQHPALGQPSLRDQSRKPRQPRVVGLHGPAHFIGVVLQRPAAAHGTLPHGAAGAVLQLSSAGAAAPAGSLQADAAGRQHPVHPVQAGRLTVTPTFLRWGAEGPFGRVGEGAHGGCRHLR